MIENVDRRVLAGFRFVDAITGNAVLQTLAVDGGPLRLRQNHSGIFAVMDAPKLTDLTWQFLPDPAGWPPSTNFELTVTDPSNRYLARRAQIAVPQPLPAAVSPAAPPPATTTTVAGTPAPVPPVTTPQDILLYPTTAAPVAPNWAVIRVSLLNTDTPPSPLSGAVIQVTISGVPPISGLTNGLGEALIGVQGLGLKLSSSATGAVTEVTTTATVEAYFDPTPRPQNWVPNPDDILDDLSNPAWKTASQSVNLAPGQTVFVNLTISL